MVPVSNGQVPKPIKIEVLRAINRNLEKPNDRSDERLENMHAMSPG